MAKLQILLIIAGCPVEFSSKVFHREREFFNYLAGLLLNSQIRYVVLSVRLIWIFPLSHNSTN